LKQLQSIIQIHPKCRTSGIYYQCFVVFHLSAAGNPALFGGKRPRIESCFDEGFGPVPLGVFANDFQHVRFGAACKTTIPSSLRKSSSDDPICLLCFAIAKSPSICFSATLCPSFALFARPLSLRFALSRAAYAPSIGSVINLLASCVTELLVFLITLLITADATVAFVTGLVFAITPVFAVYGLETSAEPFSNACITLVVWPYLRLCDSDQLGRPSQLVTWIAYSATLLFSQTVKREDILLAGIMPIMLPFMLQTGNLKRLERYRLGALVIVPSALAAILSCCRHRQMRRNFCGGFQ
jgi:hypothetical protein